jgi:hypothetical protein
VNHLGLMNGKRSCTKIKIINNKKKQTKINKINKVNGVIDLQYHPQRVQSTCQGKGL